MAKYNYVAENDISDEEYVNVLAQIGEFLDHTIDQVEVALAEKARRALVEGWKDFEYVGVPPTLPNPASKTALEWYRETMLEHERKLKKFLPGAIARLKDIRAAKALASQHDISPWWLFYEDGIHTDLRAPDPELVDALRAATEVMKRRYGAYEPPLAKGGWDSEGCYGASCHDIKAAWHCAGKQANGKFRWLVSHRFATRLDLVLSAHGTPEMGFLKEWSRGMAIWHRHPRYEDGWHISDETAIALGSAPLEEAEAALAAGSPSYATLHPVWGVEYYDGEKTRRSLRRWATLVGAEAAHRARAEARAEYPGDQGGWMPPKGATPSGVSVVLSAMTDEQKRSKRGYLNDAAIIAAAFKGHEGLIPAYLDGLETLHDGTHIPSRDCVQFYGDWLKCLCSPATRELTPTHGWEEFELKNGKPSMEALTKEFSTTGEAGFSPTLRRIFGDSIPRAYEVLRERGAKSYEEIPAPGGSVGLKVDKFVVRQLAHDDITAAAIGVITNCCQHLQGAASGAASQCYTDGTSAVWVVQEKSKIVAQAWVWRTATNGIHLDSVEALGSRSRFTEAFKAAAEAAVGRLGVEVVTAGGHQWGGKSIRVSPVTPLGYSGDFYGLGEVIAGDVSKLSMKNLRVGMDGYRRAPLPAQSDPVVVTPPPPPATHNEKPDQDYEVECEHCDADVHPAATTCWSCGKDISEWV
jgi:hypothetical protein